MGPPRPTGSRQALSALTARLAGVAPPADPNSQQRSQESKQAGEPRGMRRSPAGALSRTRLPHACCTPGAGRRWPHDEEGSLAKGKQPPPRPSPSSTDPQSAQPPPPVCPVRLPSTACRTRARPAGHSVSSATPKYTSFADERAGWFRLIAGSYYHLTPSKDTVQPAWQSHGV